jgi:hypothetical protein
VYPRRLDDVTSDTLKLSVNIASTGNGTHSVRKIQLPISVWENSNFSHAGISVPVAYQAHTRHCLLPRGLAIKQHKGVRVINLTAVGVGLAERLIDRPLFIHFVYSACAA